MTITKLERDEKGHWSCRVTIDGSTFPCHRKYGSWMVETPDGEYPRKHVARDVAEAIQEKVYPVERKERRNRERAEEEAKQKQQEREDREAAAAAKKARAGR